MTSDQQGAFRHEMFRGKGSKTILGKIYDIRDTGDGREKCIMVSLMSVKMLKADLELPYLIVKSSDAHKIHRTGTRSSGRSSGLAAVFNRYSVCPLALQPVSFWFIVEVFASTEHYNYYGLGFAGFLIYMFLNSVCKFIVDLVVTLKP